MKKTLLALVVSAAATGANAQSSNEVARQLLQVNQQLVMITQELVKLRQELAQPQTNGAQVCWYAREPYSIGARLQSGLICVAGAAPNSAIWEAYTPWK